MTFLPDPAWWIWAWNPAMSRAGQRFEQRRCSLAGANRRRAPLRAAAVRGGKAAGGAAGSSLEFGECSFDPVTKASSSPRSPLSSSDYSRFTRREAECVAVAETKPAAALANAGLLSVRCILFNRSLCVSPIHLHIYSPRFIDYIRALLA